ncbi:S41 family peptidase [Pseudoalteromonas umbrosa]|uniref:S41 family peptidase n=1 Tax=Pseudoalteromonas umbrosa TaxID=3048489 RepID=UPI0024C33273|nr:hypothetical protein [Pseudoalteromonas sp. B95]MDK1288274.1 hypothetical protein [Pseudoalteromonas sp. B95]
MFSSCLYRRIYTGILLATSSTLYANPVIDQSIENNIAAKAQFEQALPDILMFSEFAHRIRYFYPSDAVSGTRWEFFLEEVIHDMVALPEHARLTYALGQLKKIAPYIVTEPSKLPIVKDNDVAHAWAASGAHNFSSYNRDILSGNFSELINDIRTPKSIVYNDVYDNQAVYWPLYLNNQDSQKGQAFWRVMKKSSMKNPATCMAALSYTWAEIYHFWPYFEQVAVNWQESHSALLKGCLGNPSELTNIVNVEFKKLQDNHLSVRFSEEFTESGDYQLPLQVQYVEGKAIVTSKTDYLSLQVEIGDELVSIDGVMANEIIQQTASTLTSSNHVDKVIAAFGITQHYSSPDLVNLVFRKPDGDVFTTTTATIHKEVIGELKGHSEDRTLVQSLGGGIVRLNLYDIATEAQFNEAKESLSNAKAIVLDMRGYPRNFFLTREFMGYFSDTDTKGGAYMQFLQRLPNQGDTYVYNAHVGLPLNELLFDVPTVAISANLNASAAEHFLMIAQNLNIPIVGDVTMGINGDYMYNWIFGGPFHGGIDYLYTGARSDQIDGSKLIGVGVQPDYLVPVTQDSIVDNIDVQLEKAYELAKQMLIEK